MWNLLLKILIFPKKREIQNFDTLDSFEEELVVIEENSTVLSWADGDMILTDWFIFVPFFREMKIDAFLHYVYCLRSQSQSSQLAF